MVEFGSRYGHDVYDIVPLGNGERIVCWNGFQTRCKGELGERIVCGGPPQLFVDGASP